MTFSATYLGSSGWLLEIGKLRILIDPWITGNLAFPPGPWLIEGRLKKEIDVPGQIDLILLTQGLADHTHQPSLRSLSKSIPVFGSLSASKVAQALKFESVSGLNPGEIKEFRDIQIEATSGAPVPQIENGYILSHNCGTLYIEPHGFLDEKISNRMIDAVITPVFNLKLPIVGNFIKGKEILPDILKRFSPLTILASTTGGDATFTGALQNLITVEGNLKEVETYLEGKTVFIDPDPGTLYKLKRHHNK